MRLRQGLFLLFAMLATGAASYQEGCAPGPFVVIFDHGSSAIKKPASEILDNAIEMQKLCSSMQATVAGHSDTSENPDVARARAQAVTHYLASRGVFVKPGHMLAFGTTRLRVKTPPQTEESQNRRVEVSLGLP